MDFESAGTFGGVVFGGFADDAAHDFFGAYECSGGVVGALESEPPARVCGYAHGVVFEEVVGQADAHLPSKLDHSCGPHCACEVQVQVGFG